MRRQLDKVEEETNYVKEKMTPADLKDGDTRRSQDIKSPVLDVVEVMEDLDAEKKARNKAKKQKRD